MRSAAQRYPLNPPPLHTPSASPWRARVPTAREVQAHAARLPPGCRSLWLWKPSLDPESDPEVLPLRVDHGVVASDVAVPESGHWCPIDPDACKMAWPSVGLLWIGDARPDRPMLREVIEALCGREDIPLDVDPVEAVGESGFRLASGRSVAWRRGVLSGGVGAAVTTVRLHGLWAHGAARFLRPDGRLSDAPPTVADAVGFAALGTAASRAEALAAAVADWLWDQEVVVPRSSCAAWCFADVPTDVATGRPEAALLRVPVGGGYRVVDLMQSRAYRDLWFAGFCVRVESDGRLALVVPPFAVMSTRGPAAPPQGAQ